MSKKATSTTLTYQVLNHKLEEVMAKLQDPEVTIDDATACYTEAMQLIMRLEDYLETAENHVREIRTTFKAE